MHLLWVLANVWVSADTAAVKLVLAASSKDLEVKRLVKVPEVSRREVHLQRHLTVGWHDPPEMIQPANEHTGFSSENASFVPGRGPVLLGLGMAVHRAPQAEQPCALPSAAVVAAPSVWGFSISLPRLLRDPPDEFLLGVLLREIVLV